MEKHLSKMILGEDPPDLTCCIGPLELDVVLRSPGMLLEGFSETPGRPSRIPKRSGRGVLEAPKQSRGIPERSERLQEALRASGKQIDICVRKQLFVAAIYNTFAKYTKHAHDIYTTNVQCLMISYHFLRGPISKVAIIDERGEGASAFVAFVDGQISTSTIIDESGEGTMHDLRRIAIVQLGERSARSVAWSGYYLHMEVRTLYGRRMFREQ